VQRDGNRVRVNVQLIDTETSAHVWADRFENDLADLFKLQDDVVARLARTLHLELLNAEALRSLHERPQNPDAIDLTLRGFALINKDVAKTPYLQANDLFEQALKIDPSNADALAGIAVVDAAAFVYGGSHPVVDVYARAMERANQTIVLNPNQPYARYARALLLMYKLKPNDTAAATEILAEAEASLRADPSFAPAYFPMAVAEELLGRYEQGVLHLERAIRISPRDPNIGLWRQEMGRELLGMGRYEAAVQEGLKAINSGYRNMIGYASLAAFYGASDNVKEARAALAEAIKLAPQISVTWYHAHMPSYIDSPPGFREGLLKAGLPEQ
jgi:adenylate cyclase